MLITWVHYIRRLLPKISHLFCANVGWRWRQVGEEWYSIQAPCNSPSSGRPYLQHACDAGSPSVSATWQRDRMFTSGAMATAHTEWAAAASCRLWVDGKSFVNNSTSDDRTTAPHRSLLLDTRIGLSHLTLLLWRSIIAAVSSSSQRHANTLHRRWTHGPTRADNSVLSTCWRVCLGNQHCRPTWQPVMSHTSQRVTCWLMTYGRQQPTRPDTWKKIIYLFNNSHWTK